jgi:hypothetical protein
MTLREFRGRVDRTGAAELIDVQPIITAEISH